MSTFKIGDMFWGKSLTYPWWPCLIVPNNKKEVNRNQKKIGIQYHVQFIGPVYDACWITEGFLIKYQGKQHFESLIEKQINNSKSPPEKLKFDMRMSTNIQILWLQACKDAELMYLMNIEDRLSRLPKFSVEKNIINNPPEEIITNSFEENNIEIQGNISENRSSRGKSLKRSISKVSYIEDESDGDKSIKDIKVEKVNKKSSKKSSLKISNCDIKTDQISDVKETINVKKEKKKASHKCISKSSDNDDELNSTAKVTEQELYLIEDTYLTDDVEEHCLLAYLAQESYFRLGDMNENEDETAIQNLLREQWAALDVDTKLLYINDEVSHLTSSKSKVSGRKIKVPNRLRRNEDIAKIKKVSVKVRHSLQPQKQQRTETTFAMKIDNNKIENEDSNGPLVNNMFRDSMDDAVWCSLSTKDCSNQVMKSVVSNGLPKVDNSCCFCFKKLDPADKSISCLGDCQSTYHLSCSLQNKIIRCSESPLCSRCSSKKEVCFICHNSKYMKMKPLVECQIQNCSSHFHSQCIEYFTYNNHKKNKINSQVCLKHNCLTCSREDAKHSCASMGTLVSCVKCPISYHDNLICLPAGSHLLGPKKIICYRHCDNNFYSKENLSRCFICYDTNATLKCCRCFSVFHPQCQSLASYTDSLSDYVCEACKLEKPVFYGQVMWTLSKNQWRPVEIMYPLNETKDMLKKYEKSLMVRDLKVHGYFFKNRCELVPFFTGLSVLKDVINVDESGVKLAETIDLLYWNWRARMRPVTSEKFTPIGQSELLHKSLNNYQLPLPTVEFYTYINENVVSDSIRTLIPPTTSSICACSSSSETCSDDRCINFLNKIECDDSNCTNKTCNNRIFSQRIATKVRIALESISCRGIKVIGSYKENQLLGECTGRLISLRDAYKQMHMRKELDSVSYIFVLSAADIFIDCERQGNEWRHLNHSCEPNARLVCRNFRGSLKLGVVSMKAISNEEVTIDYRDNHILLKYGFFCKCASDSCSKVIGPTSFFRNDTSYISPRCCIDNAALNILSGASPKPTIKLYDMSPQKMKVHVKSESQEDHQVVDDRFPLRISCYKCGDHGEFISCDKVSCRKQYHLFCVERSSKPLGLWFCPIHFCSQCAESAITFCDSCPISFCNKHSHMGSSHKCRHTGNCSSNEEKLKVDVTTEEPHNFKPQNYVVSVTSQGMVIQSVETSKENEEKPSLTTEKVSERFSVSKEVLYGNCDLVPINDGSQSALDSQIRIRDPENKITTLSVTLDDKKGFHNLEKVSLNDNPFFKADRYEIIPCKIEDTEGVITSPCIFDD